MTSRMRRIHGATTSTRVTSRRTTTVTAGLVDLPRCLASTPQIQIEPASAA